MSISILDEKYDYITKKQLGATPMEWCLDDETGRMYLLYRKNGRYYCIIDKTIATFKSGAFIRALLKDGREYILWENCERPGMAKIVRKTLAALA